MKKNVISVLTMAAFTLGLTATSALAAETKKGDMNMVAPAHAEEEEITFGMPGMSNMVTRTITVSMQDVAYDHKNLKFKNGETIRFILINKDDTDHEFTLGTAEMQAADRERMEKMMDMNMPMEMEGEANAVSVPALQTKELIWTFKGPSQIEFACNIPGHYDAGMKGDLTVIK